MINKSLVILLIFSSFISPSSAARATVFKKNKVTIARLKENITSELGEILKLDVQLSDVSLNLRKFVLRETESALKDENDFLMEADREQLEEAWAQIVSFKNELVLEIDKLKNQLSKLNKTFKLK